MLRARPDRVSREPPVGPGAEDGVVEAGDELFSIHRRNLCERPGDFGADFLGRSLAACLFSAGDYVAAQRRRRRLVEAMEPIYARFDVLLTASTYGPAPRLDAHSTIGFWKKPSIATPFDVTGGPALSLCNGFSETGLPLAMQIIGRPFDETTVLRVADGYEKATKWHQRHPVLEAGLTPERPAPYSPPVPAVTLDAASQKVIAAQARRAGLTLDDSQLAFLYQAAPDALAMAERLRQPISWSDEPANTFGFE